MCLMFVYVCFMFEKWLVLLIDLIGFVDWLDKGFICMRSLEMCICLWPEFDCPEVTLYGWQDVKFQLLIMIEYNHPEVSVCGGQDGKSNF